MRDDMEIVTRTTWEEEGYKAVKTINCEDLELLATMA